MHGGNDVGNGIEMLTHACYATWTLIASHPESSEGKLRVYVCGARDAKPDATSYASCPYKRGGRIYRFLTDFSGETGSPAWYGLSNV